MKFLESYSQYNLISEGLKYHLTNNISILENVFRPGSKSFYDLLEEVRNYFDKGNIILEGVDNDLFSETEIGKFDLYEGRVVPLDLPMINEDLSPQVTGDRVFSIHDKKPGDLIRVEGEYVTLVEPKLWTKNKEASCLSFEAELNGKKVNVKFDDGYDAYIFESLYKGKKVKLNKPMRSSGPKKYKVYVKNQKTGKVKVVHFGDAKGGLTAKINDPEARKSFVARHRCSEKKQKTQPGYWSCRLPRYSKLLGISGGGNFYW